MVSVTCEDVVLSLVVTIEMFVKAVKKSRRWPLDEYCAVIIGRR